MADVNDYSTTPASNTADFPENQAPSTVNDGGRETQADIAKWRERLEGEATVGGTVDAITLTFSSPHTALVDNRLMTFEATGANTSTTPTLKEDSLTAKTIVKHGNQALLAGDIYGAGHVCIVQYKSDNDNYELLNPVYGEHVFLEASVTGAATTTLTISGLNSNYTKSYRVDGYIKSATAFAPVVVINGDTTGSNYTGHWEKFDTTYTHGNTPQNVIGTLTTSDEAHIIMDILPEPTSGTVFIRTAMENKTQQYSYLTHTYYSVTDNITSIAISKTSSGLDVGTFIRLRSLDNV